MSIIDSTVSFAQNVTDCGYNHSAETIHYSERVVEAYQRFLRRQSGICALVLVDSCMELNLHLSREYQSKVAALHSNKSLLVTALIEKFSAQSVNRVELEAFPFAGGYFT